jgi:hypothetical protein
MARDPTTRPKWPAGTVTKSMGALGAATLMARTVAGRAISSFFPMNARMGQPMSERLTVRPSMTKPPCSIRLWTMNSSTKTRSAGAGHATKPSPPRKRRRPSRRTSAFRSWSFCTNSTRAWSSFLGLSILNTVLVSAPGSPATWSST